MRSDSIRARRVLPTFAVAACLVVAFAGQAFAQDNVAFAQQRFARGVQLYDGGDYPQAAKEFDASLQLYESPNSRLYLARAYEKLQKLGEAMTEYQRAARESAERADVDPRYVLTRDAAAAEIVALEPRVAHVVVKVAPGPKDLTARVGGRAVPEAALGLPIAVTPGPVEVRVGAPGYQPFQTTIATRPRQTSTVEATLVLAITDGQRTASRLRKLGWVTASAGVAAVLAGGFFGLMAQKQYHELVSSCGFAACVPAQPDAVNSGRRWERLMDVSLVGGGAAALAGGVILFLGYQGPDTPQADDAPAAASHASREARLAIGWSGRALTLRGSF